jgi:hypothetical protein
MRIRNSFLLRCGPSTGRMILRGYESNKCPLSHSVDDPKTAPVVPRFGQRVCDAGIAPNLRETRLVFPGEPLSP